MPSLVNVAIHRSQFPENIRQDLLESLRARRINHKFLYDSTKATQKWLALHQAYSPSRTDADCAATYQKSFVEAVKHIAAAPRVKSEIRNPKSEPNAKERKSGNQPEQVCIVGLGCGGGQKDARLLKLLHDAGTTVRYVPMDVSAAMVLVASETAKAAIPTLGCSPMVCDLATATDLPAALDDLLADTVSWPRLFTFFGMLPNFEPQLILPRLAGLLRAGDSLLLSANLAPGADYVAGVRRILQQYDNDLMRDWLMTFLLDLGIEKQVGEMRFVVEDEPPGSGLKRVAAWFHFTRPGKVRPDEHEFDFYAGDAIRLFFSYRHTPALVEELLRPQGLQMLAQWITQSQEEGVFLVGRDLDHG